LISEDDYTCDTPDGAGKTRTDAMRRLARVVCADLTEIGEKEIASIAAQVIESRYGYCGCDQ